MTLSTSACTGSVIYSATFNSGTANGWTHGALTGSVDGWRVTKITEGSQPSTFSSFVMGTPNNGSELGRENSYLQTPVFATSVSNGAVISFTSYNENAPNDLETVPVSLDGGSSWTTIFLLLVLYKGQTMEDKLRSFPICLPQALLRLWFDLFMTLSIIWELSMQLDGSLMTLWFWIIRRVERHVF